MSCLDAISLFSQPLLDFFCNHDGPVLAACTTKRHCQVALALTNIVRKKKKQELGHAVQEFLCLRKLSDISDYLGMPAGELPELRNEVRIR